MRVAVAWAAAVEGMKVAARPAAIRAVVWVAVWAVVAVPGEVRAAVVRVAASVVARVAAVCSVAARARS